MKTIEFDGVQHQFPDDATDAEISKALEGQKTKSPEEKPKAEGGFLAGVKEFTKSIPTGMAKTVAEFARSEQIESEQRAMAFGKPEAGPKIPTGAELVKAFNLHEPEGFWGQAGQLTGEYAINPITYFGPGSAIGKFMTTIGAALGGAAGKEVGGTTGELTGALLGAATPYAALKTMAPAVMREGRQAAAELLESEGVNAVTAGQRTGSKATKYAEVYLGDAPLAGGKATAAQELAGRQFTRAALRRTGIDSDLATPAVIDAAFDQIGGEIGNIAARTNVRIDKPLVNDLLAATDEYNLMVPEGQRRAIIGKTVDDFLTRLRISPMTTGEQVQRLRSRLLRLQRGAANDPEYSNALGSIVDAIDGAIGRSITNPADLAALKLARRQYRNLIPISQASVGAGEAAAEGIITPGRLRTALTSSQRGRRDYARGRGDFAALTHAGNLIMTPLPDSGTAQRVMIHGFASALGGAAGYALGSTGHAPAALETTAGIVAAPSLMGRTLMSQPVQRYLSNRLHGQATAAGMQQQMPPAEWTGARAIVPPLTESARDALP